MNRTFVRLRESGQLVFVLKCEESGSIQGINPMSKNLNLVTASTMQIDLDHPPSIEEADKEVPPRNFFKDKREGGVSSAQARRTREHYHMLSVALGRLVEVKEKEAEWLEQPAPSPKKVSRQHDSKVPRQISVSVH